MNKTFLKGNLTKDPELRYTSGGAPVANVRMAINRAYKTTAGELKEETTYVTVVVWRKQAEAIGEYLKKGDPVLVEGRQQSRSWEDSEKKNHSTLEVVAERVEFLSRGNRTVTTAATPEGDADGAEAPKEAPAEAQA